MDGDGSVMLDGGEFALYIHCMCGKLTILTDNRLDDGEVLSELAAHVARPSWVWGNLWKKTGVVERESRG